MTSPAAALEAKPEASGAALPRWVSYVAILAVAAPVRIWAAIADQGFFWPDEIYQSLEQAHRFAFGSGIIPWEFVKGARSWLFPGLIGLLWKAVHVLGVRDGLTLVVIAKLAVVLVGLAGIAAAMLLAERLAGPGAGLMAGALCTAFPGVVVYAARCMSESASAPLIVAAALFALSTGDRNARLSGALAGLAVFFRYQNGLVMAGLLVILLAQRRKRDALQYVLAAGIVGLAGGALDWVTWGRPFHSFIEYIEFNLIEGKASNWGTSAMGYYLQTAWTSTGPWVLIVPLGLAAAWKRARGYLLLVLAYLLAHSLVPHKEYRFLAPILLLAFAMTGVGLAELLEMVKLPRVAAPVLAVAMLVLGYRAAYAEDFASMGQYQDDPRFNTRSVWHSDEDVNRALLAAGRRDDICGLMLYGIHPAWMGGYSYLNRDVPFFFRAGQGEAVRSNYLIAPTSVRLPAAWQQVDHSGRFGVFRRDGGCEPPPPGWQELLP